MDVHGGKDAAVLVPLFADAGGALHAVFTRRRHDLRRHAGEISFPGGRRDDGEALLRHARCARRTRRSACRRTTVTSSARCRRRRRSSPTTRSIRSSG